MREVDFRYLRSALESLSSSTDLVMVRGRVQAVLSHQLSPYASRRQLRFELVDQPLGGDALLVVNYRKILLVGLTEDAVRQAAEVVGREGRPFSGSLLGWDGPLAQWAFEPVPSTLPMLHGLLSLSRDYGLVDHYWMERSLVHVGWLVPVVVGWDEDGRPVFSWPGRPTESEPVDQGLPVEV